MGNLPYNTNSKALETILSPFGNVIDISFPKDPRFDNRQKSKATPDRATMGYAFVTVESQRQATKVIVNLDSTEVDGRTIKVHEAKSRPGPDHSAHSIPGLGFNPNKLLHVKLFVGNLSLTTNKDQLHELFSKFGSILECYVPVEKETGKSRCFGFVTMFAADAEVALEQCEGVKIDGRFIRVNESLITMPKGPTPKFRAIARTAAEWSKLGPALEKRQPKKADYKPHFLGNADRLNARGLLVVKLFVGNLSAETTRKDLALVFEPHGMVLDVYIPVDKDTGESRRFAFVEVRGEDAERAMDGCQGLMVKGKKLEINEAAPKREEREAFKRGVPEQQIRRTDGNPNRTDGS